MNEEEFKKLDNELIDIVSDEKYRTFSNIEDYLTFVEFYDRSKNLYNQEKNIRQIVNKIKSLKKII